MVYCGFGKLESLFTATLAWRTLLDELRPDLLVCDHSPVVCFAAYGPVPVVQLAAGFSLPPAAGETFPGYQPNPRATVPAHPLVTLTNPGQPRPRHPQIRGSPLRTRLCSYVYTPACTLSPTNTP